MLLATPPQIAYAFRNNLKSTARAHKVQRMCLDSGRVKNTPWIVLALGLRETWLRNILGGAKLVDGVWVPEDDPAKQDAGFLQISKKWHPDVLRRMEAVASGTWQPVIEGANAFAPGMVPTFRAAVPYVLAELASSLDFARLHVIPDRDRQRFAIAAHNCGKGGALEGYRHGDVDMLTSGGDYSAWVLDAAPKVEQFVVTHPNWLLP